MNKKINVLHLCSWFPHRANPYDGNFVVKHIRVLNEEVNQVALAVYEDEDLNNHLYEFDEGDKDGFPFLVIYHKSLFLRPLKLLFRFYLYWKGIRYLKKKWTRFDLIHAHVFQFAGVFSWIYSLFTGTPYVVTEHSTYFQQDSGEASSFMKFVLRRAAKKSKFILPVSHNLASRMKIFGLEGDFTVVPNIVNTDLFGFAEKKKGSGKLKFLHISSFHEMKNIPGIISVVKRLSEERSDFSLTIAGEGDSVPFIDLKRQLNISDKILSFRGEMTEEEVADLMKAHDVFVLFSDYENLPCVLLEAQSCGMPIVATDVGGVSEIIATAEFGHLIKSRDEDALFEALNAILNKFDYDPMLIRNHAIKRYSESVIRGQILNIYKT